MDSKRLSANGVFKARTKRTEAEFLNICSQSKNTDITYSSEITRQRFWKAVKKIDSKVYEACCELLKINPQESEDRTPWQLNISASKLQLILDLPEEISIKSTNYNQITISELVVGLEPNQVVISGKWQAVLRDDYHEVLQEFQLVQMFMTVAGIEIVELENKKFLQVSSGGNFSLKYLLSCQDFKIQVNPNKVTIGFNNQSHQAFCQFFTKYNERITEPIMESEIFSEEILQKIVDKEVGHKFFKITELSANNSCITFKIDESYASNRESVDSHLK